MHFDTLGTDRQHSLRLCHRAVHFVGRILLNRDFVFFKDYSFFPASLLNPYTLDEPLPVTIRCSP